MATTERDRMPVNRAARRAQARKDRNPAKRHYDYWVKPHPLSSVLGSTI